MATDHQARVLIPVKAFGRAKGRLSVILDAPTRARLARLMAESVVKAASTLPVSIVCDDDEVAQWAASMGVDVAWTPDLDLNGALQSAGATASEQGFDRVLVVHADLPFVPPLMAYASAEMNQLLVAPDRRDEGTNLLSVPTSAGFRFDFGGLSFARHLVEAERLGLSIRVLRCDRLAWDVDEPEDLVIPEGLAKHSALVTGGLLDGGAANDESNSGG